MIWDLQVVLNGANCSLKVKILIWEKVSKAHPAVLNQISSSDWVLQNFKESANDRSLWSRLLLF